jgi:hypothetical protein
MIILAVPVVVIAGLGWGLWGTVRAVRAGAWTAFGTWLHFALLAASGTVLMYGRGLLASSAFDVKETCELLKGQEYDDSYRSEHWQEPGRWFPLHNKCNASYDLVPSYVNPAVVVLAILALGCVGTAVTMAIRWRRHTDGTARSAG